MLSDSEQQRLFEIEGLLRVDDPVFAQQFDTRWPTTRPTRRTMALLTIVVAAIVTMAALVTGTVVVAVIGLCVVGTAGFWAPHQTRR